MAQYWQGKNPEHCDLCADPIRNVFIDGKTFKGPWATMDEKCHRNFGVGLGTGKGQKYEKQADGSWLKVEG